MALTSLTSGLIAWATVVTVALILVIAIVYRKLKTRYQSSANSTAAMSIISDAETGSSFDYDRNSIVDLDLDDGCGNNQDFPTMPAQSASRDVNAVDVRRLDSELNEETLEHIAAMHEDGEDGTEAGVHGKDHLTTSRKAFRHAPFKGLRKSDTGSASFL